MLRGRLIDTGHTSDRRWAGECRACPGFVDAIEKALALFVLGQVQENLYDAGAIGVQMALQVGYRPVAMLPEGISVNHGLCQRFGMQEFGMGAYDQHFLIAGAVTSRPTRRSEAELCGGGVLPPPLCPLPESTLYVNIAVLKETSAGERRVALVLGDVRGLMKLGARLHRMTSWLSCVVNGIHEAQTDIIGCCC